MLSDGIAADAKADVNQHNREQGHVTSAPDYDIWAVMWSQVIQAAKLRLNWIQSRLEFTISSNSEGMQYLRDRFSHLLPDEARGDVETNIDKPDTTDQGSLPSAQHTIDSE